MQTFWDANPVTHLVYGFQLGIYLNSPVKTFANISKKLFNWFGQREKWNTHSQNGLIGNEEISNFHEKKSFIPKFECVMFLKDECFS